MSEVLKGSSAPPSGSSRATLTLFAALKASYWGNRLPGMSEQFLPGIIQRNPAI